MLEVVPTTLSFAEIKYEWKFIYKVLYFQVTLLQVYHKITQRGVYMYATAVITATAGICICQPWTHMPALPALQRSNQQLRLTKGKNRRTAHIREGQKGNRPSSRRPAITMFQGMVGDGGCGGGGNALGKLSQGMMSQQVRLNLQTAGAAGSPHRTRFLCTSPPARSPICALTLLPSLDPISPSPRFPIQ